MASQDACAHAGRVEFTEYFPENTQGVLVQPVGEEGLLVCGTDTQRGFGRLDQVQLMRLTLHVNVLKQRVVYLRHVSTCVTDIMFDGRCAET